MSESEDYEEPGGRSKGPNVPVRAVRGDGSRALMAAFLGRSEHTKLNKDGSGKRAPFDIARLCISD